MRWVLAVLLIVHGVAHLPGFLSSWRLARLAEVPYRTTALGGAVDLGDSGVRVLGVFWLLAGLGFFLSAVALLRASPYWSALTLILAALSLLLSVLGWPEARLGVAINVLLLGYLLLGQGRGWLPGTPP